ncbi:MAG TPA: SprT-like domain-containing protein [Gemmatimonadaceae bacterium]|jgi:hypothetical protein|nr:SprT-like domain-containing protein [Gemmatimonadaceae bacterium]
MKRLRSLFVRSPVQLQLELDVPPGNADELLARLRTMGLRDIDRCSLTRNRAVMVSYHGNALRLHERYLRAPDEVHRAIARFVSGRTRTERAAARAIVLAYAPESAECQAPSRPRRTERMSPADREHVRALTASHEELNARHFGGSLQPIRIRVSGRMRSRLGQYTAATAAGEPPDIAISRAHIRRHPWPEVLHTLLHEMVHQWQAEHGHPLDHGRAFRRKAREVGIAPRAVR